MRNETNDLIGINKNVSSKINILFEEKAIETITFFNQIDGDIYPEKDLPENARKLRGLDWRGDERIKSKDDIFPPEENIENEKLVKQGEAENAKENIPMKIRKETLNYDKKKKK